MSNGSLLSDVEMKKASRLFPYLGQIEEARDAGGTWSSIAKALTKRGVPISTQCLIRYCRAMAPGKAWAASSGKRPRNLTHTTVHHANLDAEAHARTNDHSPSLIPDNRLVTHNTSSPELHEFEASDPSIEPEVRSALYKAWIANSYPSVAAASTNPAADPALRGCLCYLGIGERRNEQLAHDLWMQGLGTKSRGLCAYLLASTTYDEGRVHAIASIAEKEPLALLDLLPDILEDYFAGGSDLPKHVDRPYVDGIISKLDPDLISLVAISGRRYQDYIGEQSAYFDALRAYYEQWLASARNLGSGRAYLTDCFDIGYGSEKAYALLSRGAQAGSLPCKALVACHGLLEDHDPEVWLPGLEEAFTAGVPESYQPMGVAMMRGIRPAIENLPAELLDCVLIMHGTIVSPNRDLLEELIFSVAETYPEHTLSPASVKLCARACEDIPFLYSFMGEKVLGSPHEAERHLAIMGTDS